MFDKYPSDKAMQILLVTSDQQLESRLQAVFAGQRHMVLKTVGSRLGEIGSYAKAVAEAAVLVIELDPARPQDISALRKLMSGNAAAKPVIAITEALGPQTVREILQLHVADWIQKPDAEVALVDACARAIQAARSPAQSGGAICYTFMSASGGVGATTLAMETACLIGRRQRKFQSTCLVDLDFQAGAIADYLDLAPSLDLGEIGSNPERLDAQLLEVMASRDESGLAVLASRNSFLDQIEVDSEVVARLLELSSMSFEAMVIDLPNAWLPFSENALLGSNKVFIVTEMTVPAIRRARAILNEIEIRLRGEVKPLVIVNKFERKLFGHSLSKKDAAGLFKGHLAGFIPRDDALVREAIDRGIALYEVKARNKIDSQLTKFLIEE